MRKVLLGVALALWFAPPAHAAPRTRILYAGDWTGKMEIFAVDPTGTAPPAQLTHWRGECSEAPDYAYPFGYPGTPGALDIVPSPDGRYLLIRCGTALWLMRGDGAGAQRVAAPRSPVSDRLGVTTRPFWSTDSKRYAWKAVDGFHVRRIAGAAEEVDPSLPPANWVNRTVLPSDIPRVVPPADVAVSSPDGRRLALGSRDRIRVVDIRTGRMRILTRDPATVDLAWAPDGRSLVYVKGTETFYGANEIFATGDVEIVTLGGRTRRVVASDLAYGGRIVAVAWAKAPSRMRYTPPEPAPHERVTPQDLLADGTVRMVAADGHRIAFEACNTISVWTPSARSVESVHRMVPAGACETRDRYLLYDLALSGDRVAYALAEGCLAIGLRLFVATLGSDSSPTTFAGGGTNCGSPFYDGVGRLAGGGGLLVYDDWQETMPEVAPERFTTKRATIRRLDGKGCPCTALASTPGPLYPADVDADRVVVYGDNETTVLDRDSRRLFSVAIAPAAAQLSGSELLLVLRGKLLDYDIRTGEVLHTRPLPDAPPGPFCFWRTCLLHSLTFHDAASGLAAYTINGDLHLLRVADGADSVVAQASIARFMDDGLVYADGSRLRLVPFSQLPLRAF